MPKSSSPKRAAPPAPRRLWGTFLAHEKKHLIRHGVVGLLLGVAFFALEHGLHDTYLSRAQRDIAYHYLVDRVHRLVEPDEAPQVVVLDISAFAPQHDASLGESATQLNQIAQLVRAVAEYDPAAIGVDVDIYGRRFGTNKRFPTGYAELMRAAMELSYPQGQALPVYFAVVENSDRPRAEWLGTEAFAPFAAGVTAEEPVFKLPSATIPSALKESPQPELLPALAFALARAWDQRVVERAPQMPGLTTHNQPRDADYGERPFLVNYRALSRLEDAARDLAVDPATMLGGHDRRFWRERLENKVVLLGDVADARDLVRIPGRDHPVPGVLVHACGVDTLTNERATLYEVRPEVGAVLLIAITFVAIAAYAALNFVAFWRDWQRGVFQTERATVSLPRTRVRDVVLSYAVGLSGMAFAVIAAVVLALAGYVWLDVWLTILLEGAHLIAETLFHQIRGPRWNAILGQLVESPPAAH